MKCLSLITVVTLLAAPAFAASSVTVTDAWFRALPANLPDGGYFTLHNGSTKQLTLTGAGSSACGKLMLHKSEEASGMSSMSDIAHIDVPAGGTLSFAPGGYHLMCMNPTALMKQGSSVSGTLDFADGSKIDVRFAVRSASGK